MGMENDPYLTSHFWDSGIGKMEGELQWLGWFSWVGR